MTTRDATVNDDALPNSLPRPPLELTRLEEIWETPRGWRFFKSVNNTNIGLLYIGTAILFFILAGILALIMRVQLAVPPARGLGSSATAIVAGLIGANALVGEPLSTEKLL